MGLLMVGNSDYSIMLKRYVEELGETIEAFVVDREYRTVPELDGVRVLSFDEIVPQYSSYEYQMILGIGCKKLGNLRKEIFLKCKAMGYSFENYIHPTSHIDKDAEIGEGNVFFENVVIQKNTKIGNGNLFFSNSVIMHDNSIGDYNSFCACSVLNGFVAVGNCCFVGANATLRNGIGVGDQSLIGAGAYVNKSCEPDCVILPASSRWFKGESLKFAERI